jgi:hypothetical protein
MILLSKGDRKYDYKISSAAGWRKLSERWKSSRIIIPKKLIDYFRLPKRDLARMVLLSIPEYSSTLLRPFPSIQQIDRYPRCR